MRRHSSLELFILSCFDRGLQTPYDLQRRVGLSLGATTPALKRLLKAGLLKKTETSTATKRPRHEYQLTPSGRAQAKAGWKYYLDIANVPSDLDGLLRVYDMASHYGASKASLKTYLQHAAKSRVHAADVQALACRGVNGGREGFSYPQLRASFELARLVSEAETLAKLDKESTEKKSRRVSSGRS